MTDEAALEGRVGVRGLLGRGPFRGLLAAQALSSLGDWVGTLALIARAFELTGSPVAVGGVLVLRLLPPILAAPLGGVLADRLDRRALMVTSNLAMGALIVLVPFVPLVGLYAIAFVSESLALLFLPARDAAIPDLVRRGSLAEANALILSTSYAAIPIASALFSALTIAPQHLPDQVPLGGRPLVVPFAFDALTFLFAAAILGRMPLGPTPAAGRVRLLGDLREAARYLRREPRLAPLAVGVGVSMLGGGVLFAFGITYVHETLGAGDPEFGFLTSLWGAGMALGVVAVRRIPPRSQGRGFHVAVTASGGVLVGMGILPALPIAYLAAVAFGLAFAVALALAIGRIQGVADVGIRGRLLAGAHMLLRGGLALGALGIGGAVGPIRAALPGASLDPNQVGLITGGVVILVGAALARGAEPGPTARDTGTDPRAAGPARGSSSWR